VFSGTQKEARFKENSQCIFAEKRLHVSMLLQLQELISTGSRELRFQRYHLHIDFVIATKIKLFLA